MTGKIAITLPQQQIATARQAVAEGRAPSVSEYISQAIARRAADEELAATLATVHAGGGSPTRAGRAGGPRGRRLGAGLAAPAERGLRAPAGARRRRPVLEVLVLAPAGQQAGQLGGDEFEIAHRLGHPEAGRSAGAERLDAFPQHPSPPQEHPVPDSQDLVPDVTGHPVAEPAGPWLALAADQPDLEQVPHAARHRGRAGMQELSELRGSEQA